MRWTGEHRVEWAIDAAAAAALAGAVAFAASATAPVAGAAAAAAAAPVFLLAFAALRTVPVEVPAYRLAGFQPLPIEPVEAEPLPQLRLMAPNAVQPPNPGEELLLVDRLGAPESGSRVVRLFDPRPMPTTNELATSVEHHRASSRASCTSPDASAALSEALAALRRSMR